MGQRELADLVLRSDPSKLAGSIIGASFCEPDVPIWPCCVGGREFFGRRQEELADLSHGGDARNRARLGEPKDSTWSCFDVKRSAMGRRQWTRSHLSGQGDTAARV